MVYKLNMNKFVVVFLGIIFFNSINAAAVKPSTKSQLPPISPQAMQRLLTAVDLVHHYYIKPVTDEELINNAIDGLLTKLDAHSSYLRADDLRILNEAISGKFDGIGVMLIPNNGVLKVVSPLDGSPAQKAGIKAGDLIIRINDQLVLDMPAEQAINMLRGPNGSKVNLQIIRQDIPNPLKISITREPINIPTVKERLYDKFYGYLRIAVFYQTTAKDVVKAIKKLNKLSDDQLKGIVIDLRNNPGGLFDSCIEVTNDFLDATQLKSNQIIVSIKGSSPDQDKVFKVTDKLLVPKIPVVILINEGTASAAEIFAGALQDHKRALLVGTKTFGKGSIQTVFPIDQDSAIKLTTSLYYTPSGNSIQAKGIVPDVVIKDLAVSQVKDAELPFGGIYEEDLPNHIANNSSEEDNADTQQYQNKELLQKDFQLYEALLVLKGLVNK